MTTHPTSQGPDGPDGRDDLDALAGEYVLGSLPSAQRREVEQRLPHDAALRAAVDAWEARLLPLAALARPVVPSPRLWTRIARSVDARGASAASVAGAAGVAASPAPTRPKPAPRRSGWPIWQSLVFWRGLSVTGITTAAVLGAVLVARLMAPVAAPQFMVVLVAPQSQAPGWVVQASTNREVRLIPMATFQVPADKALEFWTKADGWNGPVSLGLVKPGETLRIPLDKLPPLQPNQLFELTLEQPTGSPIGKPTGPVQFIGRAVKVM